MNNFIRSLVLALAFLAPASIAFGQGAVLQSGSVATGHLATWAGNGLIQDGGPVGGAGAPGGSLYATQYKGLSGFLGTGPGTSGQCLISAGSGAPPAFGSCPGNAYTAGAGLTLTGSVFSLNLNHANTWTATQVLPNGSILNAWLLHPSMTIGGQSVALGSATSNQGNGGKIQLSTGSTSTNHCVKFDASGNTVDAGAACGSGGGGGTVNTGAQNNLGYYAAAGTTISGLTTLNNGTLRTGTTGIPSIVSMATNGGLLIGSASGQPTVGTLTAGSGIAIVNAANSITISSSGVGDNGNWVNAVTACGVDNTGATDTTTALNNCILANHTVGLPAGIYQTSGAINLPASGDGLIGAGMWATTINIHSTSAAAINITGGQNYLGALNVDRTGTPGVNAHGVQTNALPGNQTLIEHIHVQNHHYGFYLGPTFLSTCSNCQAEQNYSDGFRLWNSAGHTTMQWYVNDSFSAQNDGWGFQVASTAGVGSSTLLQWSGDGTFANKSGGFAFIGAAGATLDDVILNNPTSSGDNGDGILFQTVGGTNLQINGFWVELAGQITNGRAVANPAGNAGNGIDINGTNGTVNIAGGMALHNSYNGIALQGSSLTNANISGVTLNTNSLASAGTYDGISSGVSGTHVILAGVRAFNEAGGFQNWGFQTVDGNNSTLVGADLTGNAGGGCTTSAGTIVGAGNQGAGCPTSGGGGSSVVFSSTASIASAATTNLGSVASNLIAITGTAGITSFGSSASTTNARYIVYFANSGGTITGGANITTPGSISPITWATGDVAQLRYVGGGAWTIEAYLKQNGQAFQNPVFASGSAGIVPASGGGTTNFLRADGSWAAPSATAGNVKFDSTISIASAGTTDLGSVASNLVAITGTTGITSFGNSASVSNARYLIYFVSSGGTVTGGANITTPGSISPITWASGDVWAARYTGAGQWTVEAIFKANGQAFQNPVFTSGAAGTVSASGGGTTNFLRADGTWATPSSGGVTSAIAGTNMQVSAATGAVTFSTVTNPTWSGGETISGGTTGLNMTGSHTIGIDLRSATNGTGIALGNAQSIIWGPSGNGGMYLDGSNNFLFGIGATAIVQYQTQVPAIDNTMNLGSGALAYANIYAHNALNVVSDRREKQFIEPSNLGLDFINRLKPVSYFWRTGSDVQQHYGVIAQDVAATVGSKTGIVAVPANENDRYTVRYEELIAPLIKSVQDLSQQMSAMKADNDNLRQQVRALESRTPKRRLVSAGR